MRGIHASAAGRVVLLLGLGLAACVVKGPTEVPDDEIEDVDGADATAIVWPDEEFRYKAPEPGPAPDLAMPAIQEFELDNGAKVFLSRQEKLPTVWLNIQWELGGMSDPARQVGRTPLCMSLIGEGTQSSDKAQWEARQDDFAVSVWASGGTETSSVYLRALKPQFEDGLALLSEMMREPGLRANDLDRLRERRKSSIEQGRATPRGIASGLLGSMVYGKNHPYGKMETPDSLDAIKARDCKRVVSQLKPGNARIFITGKVTESEIREAFKKKMGDWSGRAPTARKPSAPQPPKGTIFFVHVPKAAQSMIYIAALGGDRTDPNYATNEVMMGILGGGFTSRINMNLREDKGFAYGAGGGLSYRRHGGYFRVSSSVRTDSTGESLRELAKEIETMRTTDPSQEEIDREVASRLLSLPARFATASAAMQSFRTLVYYGLPADWYSTYQQSLGSVDIAGVRQAAEELLPASGYTVVIAGDAGQVLGDVEAIAKEGLFGKQGIVFVDADGNAAKRPKIQAPAPQDTASQ